MSRSDAARRGWVTRRQREAERRRVFERRSAAAKRGWVTRREHAGTVAVRVTPVRIPVFAEDNMVPGAALGFARWPDGHADAEAVAQDARPDDELETVYDDDVPALGGRIYVARFARVEEPLEPEEPLDDLADEWEMGFEYRGGDRGSNVDVNFRLARADGAPFGPTEAARVFSEFRNNLGRETSPIPSGYVMAWINWHRPSWRSDRWHGSDDELDLTSFLNPMYTESDNDGAWSEPVPTRLGSVKK